MTRKTAVERLRYEPGMLPVQSRKPPMQGCAGKHNFAPTRQGFEVFALPIGGAG